MPGWRPPYSRPSRRGTCPNREARSMTKASATEVPLIARAKLFGNPTGGPINPAHQLADAQFGSFCTGHFSSVVC
jgi:hypothetical protein